MKHIKVLLLVLGLVFSVSACELSDQVNIVDVKESSVSIGIGQSYTLEVVVSSDAATYLQFASDNTEVATVSSEGVITGVSKGVTAIQVRAGNGFDYVTVRVAGGVLEDASSGDSEQAYVVSTEAELLEALNEGIYQITLGADITISTEIALSHPFEIITDGYEFDVDFSINDDFYGALAFKNGESGSYVTTRIDMTGLTIPVTIFVESYDDFGYTWDNPLGLEYESDPFQRYLTLGESIPIFTLEDLSMIDKNTSHVFAEGTPYALETTSYGEHESFIFLRDIYGDVELNGIHYIVQTNNFNYVYDDQWSFIGRYNSQFEFYAPFYSNLSVTETNPTTSDIPQSVLDVITSDNQSANDVSTYYYLELDVWEESISNLDNAKIYGNDFGLYYIHFDDELVNVMNNVSVSQLNFSNITMSDDNSAILVNNVYGETSTFLDVDFDNIFAEFDDDDETALLIGSLGNNDVLIIDNDFNDIYVISHNTNFGLLIGLSEEVGFVKISSVNIDAVYLDIRGENSGLMIGEMIEGVLEVTETNIDYVFVELAENGFGLLAGELDSGTYATVSIFVVDEVRINLVDNVSNVGVMFGDVTSNVYVHASHIDVDDVTIESIEGEASAVSGTIGVIRSDAQVEFSDLDYTNVEILGIGEHAGLIAGKILESTLTVHYINFSNNQVSGNIYIGGLIGSIDMEDERVASKVTLNRLEIRDIDVNGKYQTGGFIASLLDANLTISNVYVNELDVFSEQEDVGGIVGTINRENFMPTITLENIEINTSTVNGNRSGGAFGYVRKANVFVHDVYIYSTLYAGFRIGGFAAYVEDSNLDISELDVTIFAESTNTTGGIFGALENSIARMDNFEVNIEVFTTLTFGAIAAEVSSSYFEFVTLESIDMTMNFDMTDQSNIYGRFFGSVYESRIDGIYDTVNVFYNNFTPTLEFVDHEDFSFVGTENFSLVSIDPFIVD